MIIRMTPPPPPLAFSKVEVLAAAFVVPWPEADCCHGAYVAQFTPGGNARELARAKNQKKQAEMNKGKGKDDGMTLAQRRERDAAALRAKQEVSVGFDSRPLPQKTPRMASNYSTSLSISTPRTDASTYAGWQNGGRASHARASCACSCAASSLARASVLGVCGIL